MRKNEQQLVAPREALKSGAILNISPRQIVVRDGRRPISRETLERIKESVSKLGVLNPISVFMIEREEEGEMLPFYVLSAGLHRLQAAIELGLNTVPARLVPGEDGALVEAVENIDRAELSGAQRLELIGRITAMLAERKKRPISREGLGAVSGRAAQKVGRPKYGDSLAARALNVSREDIKRAVRFGSLDPEAREALKDSVKLRNSTEAVDAAARIPSGKQVEFIERLERAERIQDVTREKRQTERFENEAGEDARLAYALGAEPVSSLALEIMPPRRLKAGNLSLTDRAYGVINDFGTDGAEALFRVAVRNLNQQFLTQRATAEIAAEIARRGG